MALRNDTGHLWENYLLSERQKLNNNKRYSKEHFFWRTYDGQEIDLIETRDDQISAYECKWGKSSGKTPGAFSKAYPDASYKLVNRDNYLEFVL